MLGRSHALSGLLAGCGLIALTPAPWPVELLTVALCGGGALVNDIDQPGSKVARSLGPITYWLARGMALVSLAVYHGTRGDRDPVDRQSGHRLVTHTVPAAAMFGAMAAVAVAFGPWPAAVTCALLVALMAGGIRVAGGTLALAGGGVAYWTVTTHPGWSLLFGAAVSVGALAHTLGDSTTNSGVPLWWPVMRDGRRWAPVKTTVTFRTGSHLEVNVVTPLLAFCALVAASLVTGVLPMVVTAVVAAAGGGR